MTSKKTLRHVSISNDPDVSSKQLGENARDTNTTLLGKIDGRTALVRRYAALGSTSRQIHLIPGDFRPSAVMLARACLSNSPGDDIGAVGRCNFYHDAHGVGVYEPAGLSADVMYDLLFLILE